MGKILTGFEHVAAKPKGRDPEQAEAPAQESMRGGRTLLANPSTDEKKIKRRIRRNAAAESEVVSDDPIGEDLWSTALLIETPPVVPVGQRTAATEYGEGGSGSGGSWTEADDPHKLSDDDLEEALRHDGFQSQDARRKFEDHAKGRGLEYRQASAEEFRNGLDLATEARLLDEDENPRTVASSGDDLRHLAWSDMRYTKNFLHTLNGFGVVLNYTTDYGTTSAEGILHYDGETASVTNKSGTSISVPYFNVLRVEPSENPAYPAPHSSVGPDADPGGAGFDPVSPIFHGLVPSGATASVVEADYGTSAHPIEDEPHALQGLMQQFRMNHPSTSLQQQSLTPEHQQKLTAGVDDLHEAVIEDHWPFQPWNPEKGRIEDHWPWTRREDARPWFKGTVDQDPLSEHPGNDAPGVDLDYAEDDGPLHKKDSVVNASLDTIQAANAATLAALRGTK